MIKYILRTQRYFFFSIRRLRTQKYFALLDIYFIFLQYWTTDDIVDIHVDTIHRTYIRTMPDTLQYIGRQSLPKTIDYIFKIDELNY